MLKGGLYQLADLRVASDLPLLELAPSDTSTTPLWNFSIGAPPYPGPPARWFHQWSDSEGQRWLRLGRHDGHYVLRFERWATFVIDRANQTIACHTEPDTPPETIRHLLLNQVLPLLPGATSRVVLHAAAVRTGDRAIGFVGRGGAGKSSLCAALNQLGCGLITDDALVIERRAREFVTTPSYAAIRLWPDVIHSLAHQSAAAALPVAHYTGKLRIVDPAFDQREVTLDRLYLLAEPSAVSTVAIRRLGRREAVIALVGAAFQLDIEDRGQLMATFDILADMTERIPVFALTVPWDLPRLQQSAGEVLAGITAA